MVFHDRRAKKKRVGDGWCCRRCRSAAISSLQVLNPTAFYHVHYHCLWLVVPPCVCECVRAPPSSTVASLTRRAIKADQTDCDVKRRCAYVAPYECKVHHWTGAALPALLTRLRVVVAVVVVLVELVVVIQLYYSCLSSSSSSISCCCCCSSWSVAVVDVVVIVVVVVILGAVAIVTLVVEVAAVVVVVVVLIVVIVTIAVACCSSGSSCCCCDSNSSCSTRSCCCRNRSTSNC